jgi:hypothetical protein
MKCAIVIAGCLGLAVIALLLLVPTLAIGFEGGFRRQQVSSETSPDGRLELIVTKRVAFPANEWVDPSVVVNAELREVTTRRVIASQQRILVEDSDFKTPVIQWGSDEVRVSAFDQRKGQTVTLKHRPNHELQRMPGSGFISAERFTFTGPAWLARVVGQQLR